MLLDFVIKSLYTDLYNNNFFINKLCLINIKLKILLCKNVCFRYVKKTQNNLNTKLLINVRVHFDYIYKNI